LGLDYLIEIKKVSSHQFFDVSTLFGRADRWAPNRKEKQGDAPHLRAQEKEYSLSSERRESVEVARFN